jgi:hypothetical protein
MTNWKRLGRNGHHIIGVLSHHLPEETEEKHKNIRIANIPAEI